MRRSPALTLCALLAWPTGASASRRHQPADTDVAAQSGEPDDAPTSSPAPESTMEPEGPSDETVEAAAPTGEDAPTLQEERERVKHKTGEFNRHGVGIRGGIVVIPTWVLSPFLASHTNALCRGGSIGDFAAERGLLKTQGCNFYVGGEYTYRKSRIFDIVASVGYQHAHAPDGYWLDESEWADSCTTHDGDQCNLAAADYTEVDLGVVFLEADFVARAPVVLTKDIELGIGGGAGIGLGIVVGGVYQTALGSAPGGYNEMNPSIANGTCNTLQDLADFTRCTPRYDPLEEVEFGGDDIPPALDELGLDPSRNDSVRPWAKCGKDDCNSSDLARFGYRKKQDDIPPVIPVVNLILSVRMIVRDVFGLNIQGGWNTGFYFGASMQYFFGKDLGKKKSSASSTTVRRSGSPLQASAIRF